MAARLSRFAGDDVPSLVGAGGPVNALRVAPAVKRIVAATMLGVALLAAAVLAVALRPGGVPKPGETPSAAAAEIAPAAIRVLDGDTIRVNDARPDYRLVGFNSPETRRAQCEAEAQLGARATARLREIVRAGGLTCSATRCPAMPRPWCDPPE